MEKYVVLYEKNTQFHISIQISYVMKFQSKKLKKMKRKGNSLKNLIYSTLGIEVLCDIIFQVRLIH